ncbi:MAG: DUF6157 family protein [Desulfotalea sp.]
MEKLITISADSPTDKAIIPENDGKLAFLKYSVLIGNPYKYTPLDYFREVHHIKREKPHLKIESYSIKRTELVKKFGWGIHVNDAGQIALVACDSKQYEKIFNDPSVLKQNAYRNKKIGS